MRNKAALGFLTLMVWLFMAANAWAIALGKISVASHLGERFYAEVPLQLDHGESVSNIFVSLASPSDYRILEIYRDPAISSIQVDVKTDKRGPRVVLSTDTAVNAPFFNLVLKLRYGRATQFKKYPVFLDIPKMSKPSKMAPVPTIKQGQPRTKARVSVAPPAAVTITNSPSTQAKSTAPAPGSTFKPFDGWARISRYGPMVYGDTITTVAERLMIDHRYTRQQVMVALFIKNRAKFDHDNINLIKAGTYLDVPTAAEVQRISPEEARSTIAKQEKVWKQLIKQPKYAAIAKAQKDRYSKRVRVGEHASGVASAPLTMGQGSKQGSAIQVKPGVHTVQKEKVSTSSATATMKRQQSELENQLQQLQQQNTDLQNQLAKSQKQLAQASTSGPSGMAAAAADKARVKRLQIMLARMQAQRDAALQKAKAQPSPLGWLTYVLLVVIVVLLAIVGFLMRKDRSHPAMDYASSDMIQAGHDSKSGEPEPEPFQSTFPSDMFEDAPEIEVEEVPNVDSTATMQMNSVDLSQAFTDSIPDLTDADTGEMDAFEEGGEDEPDPNVDYLAEADVYMRYGMEDEAIQQVKMAMRLDPSNPEAHVKMVQVQKAKNDQDAVNEAMQSARKALSGDALSQFEEAVSSMTEAVDVFGDTLPPTVAEELIEFPDSSSSADESVDILAGMDTSTAETKSDGKVDKATNDIMDLSGEWPEFEDAETSLQEAEAETPSSSPIEQPTAVEEKSGLDKPEAESLNEVISGGNDFDLSDIEIPDSKIEEEVSDESRSQRFLDTGDMEKTVAIDWSKDTSVDTGDHEDIISESGAGAFEDTVNGDELEFQLGQESPAFNETELEPEPEPEPEADIKSAPVLEEASKSGGLAIDDGMDLGDFDFDKEGTQTDRNEAFESTDEEEFTSTIQTTLAKMEASTVSDKDDFDFDLSSELESGQENDTEESIQSPGNVTAPKKNDNGGFLLDLDDDTDATQKLDSLLSEFEDESEKDGGDKKS